jgi:hypothetical protein
VSPPPRRGKKKKKKSIWLLFDTEPWREICNTFFGGEGYFELQALKRNRSSGGEIQFQISMSNG